MKRKVLILSYAFPPQNVVGATRPFKFFKYLPNYGWQPFVLTRTIRDNAPLDNEVLNNIPDQSKIVRCPDIEPAPEQIKFKPLQYLRAILNRTILFPDAQVLWNFPVIVKAVQIIKEKKIKIIFCTVPPYSSLIGAYLISKITAVPFIADFRDLWSLHEYFVYVHRKKFRQNLVKKIESHIIKNAEKVILNTPLAKEKMGNLYPIHKKKFYILTNGFDDSDFTSRQESFDELFTIVHTGSFYLERNPLLFLKGLSSWVKSQADQNQFSKNIQVLFIGKNSNEYQEQTKELGIDHLVRYINQISKEKLYKFTQNADVLLLFLGLKKESDYVIPAKFYEYLAVAKPILAFVPPDSQTAQLVNEYELGITITSEDSNDVKNALDVLYIDNKQRKNIKSNFQNIQSQFEYKKLSDDLAGILNSI